MSRTRVQLPPEVAEPLEVYVNGVAQKRGVDYRMVGRELVFDRPLAREGRLGFWRWLWIAIGVVGVYRQNDSVDVVYEVDGRRQVANSLPIERVD